VWISALLGLLCSSAFAQSQPDETAGASRDREVEEILVQGQAVSGIQADAPVSVSQFGAQELDALGIEDVADVAKYTPNLEIRTASATTPTFFIRGVGLNDFTANAEGAVAIFQGGVPLSLPAIQALQIFDVERLEVLRGPQGTGAYRNASAGAIRILTNKPSGDFGADFQTSFGRFGYRNFEGSLEMPVLGDVLSTRFAFSVQQRDPIVENRCGGIDLPIGPERITNFNPNGGTDSQWQGEPYFDTELGAEIGYPFRGQPSFCNESSNREPMVANPYSRVRQRTIGGQIVRTLQSPRPQFIQQTSAVPPGLPDRLNDVNQWAARGQFRFIPPDSDMDWLLELHGGKIDQDFPVGQVLGTGGIAVPAQSDYALGTQIVGGYIQPEVSAEFDSILASLGSQGTSAERTRQAYAILGSNLARRVDTKPFEGDYNRDPEEKMDTFGGALTGEIEFDGFSLTMVSAAEHYDRHQVIDADYSSDQLFEFVNDEKAWQFSQQVEIQGELDSQPLTWNAGFLYVMNDLDWEGLTDASGATVTPKFQEYQQQMWSIGAFVGFDWTFLDDFDLEGGVRYNWERKDFSASEVRAPYDQLDTAPTLCDLGNQCDDSYTSKAPTGSLSLTYHLADEVSVYAKYSRGFKTAQFSVGGPGAEVFTLATPEGLDAFEVGLNGSWFDGRLAMQMSLFDYIYEDYQLFTTNKGALSPPTRIVLNAKSVILYGAEFEATVEPLDSLIMVSRFGWLEGEFLDYSERIFRTPADSTVSTSLVEDIQYTGNRLPNTPQFTWSGSVQYTFDLGRFGFLIPRWDGTWTDTAYFDGTNGVGIPNINGDFLLPPDTIGQQAYWLHNLRLSWRNGEERLEVSGWVRNLTDEVYKTLAFDATNAYNLVGNLIGDPRTYGVTVAISW